ncbi:hypothetical protein PRUPE_4G224300 [Prunus persica]|uniref:Uncharacterized protein n=1 Tax=Prunus persica TaxID=3760 RepID=A0A251PPI9_PRUPE|nr:hypothetical protein PRUPE_4G224300 [Prunus persica]
MAFVFISDPCPNQTVNYSGYEIEDMNESLVIQLIFGFSIIQEQLLTLQE